MSDKLLPCPLRCKGERSIYSTPLLPPKKGPDRHKVFLEYRAICETCYLSTTAYNTREEAVSRWNTRVLVCPDCGERLEKVAMYHQGYAYGVGEYAEPCKVGDEGYYNHNGLDQQCNAFIYVGCKCQPATCAADDNAL